MSKIVEVTEQVRVLEERTRLVRVEIDDDSEAFEYAKSGKGQPVEYCEVGDLEERVEELGRSMEKVVGAEVV